MTYTEIVPEISDKDGQLRRIRIVIPGDEGNAFDKETLCKHLKLSAEIEIHEKKKSLNELMESNFFNKKVMMLTMSDEITSVEEIT